MEEFDLKKLMSDMQGGKSMPEKDNKMKKKNGVSGKNKALSELWVFQEKVDMKVSAFSFNSSLLIFGYL